MSVTSSPETSGKARNLWQRIRRSRWARVLAAVGVTVMLLRVTAPWLVGPPVPRRLTILTGGRDGAYFAFAGQYASILAKNGITLDVVPTNGSVDNLRRLQQDQAALAIVQGGIDPLRADDEGRIESLASLYFEPVWLFHRCADVTRLTDLRGRRIAVGGDGSGTRAIALKLLAENGLTPPDAPSGTTAAAAGEARLSALSGREAADAVLAGEIDAAFFVISPQAPLIRELVVAGDIRLMDFRRGAAYAQRYPYLSTITLGEGMLDLDLNLPARDVRLLAPTANLVATADLHPALIPLLLEAVNRVHADGGFLAPPGTFPSSEHVQFGINHDADRYLQSGPSFLYRHLPFWIASGIDRTKLLLLPLCTLLLPFLRVAPPIYRWRIRSKIYRWYHVLRNIDQRLKTADARADFSDDIRHLRELESELADVSVPLSYMEEFYNLRVHIAFIRGVLVRRERARALKRQEEQTRKPGTRGAGRRRAA